MIKLPILLEVQNVLPSEFKSMKPLSPLEFQDAAHIMGMDIFLESPNVVNQYSAYMYFTYTLPKF